MAHQTTRRMPYPFALQSVISLVLLATLPGAFGATGHTLSPRFGLVCLLVGSNLALCWLIPARYLDVPRQFGYLSLQIGIASLTHVVAPSALLGYVYLMIVLQAVYLFPPLLWIPFAGCVYLIWSGALMIASSNLIEWMRGNLALAFPVLCILVAAALYARQHRRYEQVQQMLQQVQRRYDALALDLRDAQQRAAIEERRRLAQTIGHDVTAALGQIEQNIASAISQAQTNLARLESTVVQTRAAAATAIERMRTMVATLRHGARDDRAPEPQPLAFALPPDELMTGRSQRTLTWCLPLAFAAVALPLTLLQQTMTPGLGMLVALCCTVLIGGYVFTQRLRNPLLVQIGLAGQVLAVLGMVFVTQTLPLMLGLLLVIWQIALRLSAGQIVTFLIGIQMTIGLALARLLPVSIDDRTQLLIFGVTCVAVIGLVGTARRRFSHRHEAVARLRRLAHLTSALGQQVAQTRALAVAVERTRVAREIHDDLGHRLVLLNVQLQLVDDMIADDPAAALDQLCSTQKQLREAWSSVLNAADTALALDGATVVPAIRQLIDQFQTLTSMRISLRIIGDLTQCEVAMVCAIYRAVQEGLTNAYRHARAQRAAVLLYCDDVVAQVRVDDDGCGLGPAPLPLSVPGAAGHFGLIGLRERAELLGGSVEAGPRPEGGFGMEMTIPLR